MTDQKHWLRKSCAELWPEIYLRPGRPVSVLYFTPMWLNIVLVLAPVLNLLFHRNLAVRWL